MGVCGVSLVKYLVFGFNLLFALTGLAILTCGAYIQSAYHDYSYFICDFRSVPILMIVVGSVVFIIAFLGCCGAVKENSCMVLTFGIFLLIILLCEIGIGIAGYIMHGQLVGTVQTCFNKTMTEYNENEKFRKLIETEMECCGINEPLDYENIFHNKTLPNSCCKRFPDDSKECTLENAHQDGCMPKFLQFLESASLKLAGVGIGIVLILLIGVACYLYRAFRRNFETV